MMTREFFLWVCLTMVVCAVVASAAEADVRLVSSDQRGVVLEYRPTYQQPSTINADGRVFEIWTFEYGRDREDLLPGSPRLQVRPVLLAFPGISGHTVEVLAADHETVEDVWLAPVPTPEGDFEHLQRSYKMKASDYSRNDFDPASVAELVSLGIVRGFALGEIRFSPLRYNAGSRTLRKYSRILVRVNFGPASYRVRGGPVDPLMKNLPVNYDVARYWNTEAHPVSIPQFRNSVFASGPWFRFIITESGMCKLRGSDLLAAGVPSSTDPRTVRIFSSGGIEPPASATAPYPDDVLELALYVYDGGTPGGLDAADYVLFYGQGTRGWRYNPSTKSFSHTINLYSEVAHYWLTYGGAQYKPMAALNSLTDPSPFVPSSVVGKVFREDERVNVQKSGRQWLGQSFNPNDAMTYLFPMPGFDPLQRMTYRFALGAHNAAGSSSFGVTEHGTFLVSTFHQATPGDYPNPYVAMAYPTVTPFTNGFSEPVSQLRLSFTSGAAGTGYIDWIEISYVRQLIADADVFNFHTRDTTAVAEYSIGGFTQGQPIWVFDVTKFDSVVQVLNTTIVGDQCTFQTQLAQGAVREFYVVGGNGFKSASALQSFANQNLHGDTASVDLVVISHRDFLSAAQRLKTHRERLGPDLLSTRVVDVDQVYNEFSGGQLSPVGIRNYLRYLYYNSSPRPTYVTLFGDGDYDYKRISTTGPNWIPAWETYESFSGSALATYGTEDSLVTFEISPKVQYAVGRLPVRNQSEASSVVDKLIEYETGVASDPWKMRVTFVADDGREEGTLYSSQTETLAERFTPALFEKQKIYTAAFPLVITSAGPRRPMANDAIVDRVNRGTLVLNFIGHGNPRVWQHEYVFVRENEIPSMTNRGEYFLLVAATCNFSQFDNPFDQSGGEQIVLKPDGGAIASVAASRAVFAYENYALAETFYLQMFPVDSLGTPIPRRLGDIMFGTKLVRFAENDKKFLLLGDPSVRFALPHRFAIVDSINGNPTTSLVPVRGLDSVRVAAAVKDIASGQTSNFDGQALITVYDADKRELINKPLEGFPNFAYTAPGGVIFRGQSSIASGRLSSSFIVPKDISYDSARGRISVFFRNSTEDGAGVTRNIIVGGTNPNAALDTIGPRITLYIDNRSFHTGDRVSENPRLISDLYDEHGINSSNAGVGHRLEAWIDDQTASIDLSDSYQSKLDSYQEGTINYVLSGLRPGSHRVRLRAWDTYNNSSVAQTNFDVSISIGLRISNMFNYPNPFSSSTFFTFQHNQLQPVDAEVKIYTVAGRLIESLTQSGIPDLFVRIPWDGRDRDGDEIANGVYLYKIIVRTQDGRFSSEALGKLSKVR